VFTVPNPQRLTLYKDDAVATLLRSDFQARFGEHSGVIYPVDELKLDGQEIKVKDARTGLAWNGHEFLPFVLEHPGLGTEFTVRMQSVVPQDGDVVRLSASSGATDECTFSAFQKDVAHVTANLGKANPAAVGAFGRHLRAHFGAQVVHSKADGKGGIGAFVGPLVAGVVLWLVWLFLIGLADSTAETLDTGGSVFVVLIPFAVAWGFIKSVPVLETLVTFGSLPLILWLTIAMARSERRNARAICDALAH
jgi:hypothetical protein